MWTSARSPPSATSAAPTSHCKRGSKMIQALLFAAALAGAPTPAPAAGPSFKVEHPSAKYPGEEEIADYAHAPAYAGTAPFEGEGMWKAFHEKAGVDRVV